MKKLPPALAGVYEFGAKMARKKCRDGIWVHLVHTLERTCDPKMFKTCPTLLMKTNITHTAQTGGGLGGDVTPQSRK